MKNLHKKPTDENILDTFCQDTIGRNQDVIRFCNILDTVEDSCSISLDAQWGDGKTFFIKQAKMLLDYKNAITILPDETTQRIKEYFRNFQQNVPKLKIDTPHATVYFDAWENDNHVDPILSMIYSIATSLQVDYKVKSEHSFVKIIGSLAEIISGRNVSEFFEAIKGDPSISADIRKENNVSTLMKEFLDAAIAGRGDRLVFFIDELDRCNPSFAVRLLERIKHFFDDARVTFVFSVNVEQIQFTIKNYYGAGFNASRYLEKFFDLRISLPAANYDKCINSIGFYESTHIYDITCGCVIRHLHLGLRDIAKYVRLIKTAYDPKDKSNHVGLSDERTVLFSKAYIVPIMLGLLISDAQLYKEFVEGKNPNPMLDILTLPELEMNRQFLILRGNETFVAEQNTEQQRKVVDLKSRLKEIYDAIFVETYSRRMNRKIVGELNFDAQIKTIVLRTVSLLSSDASLN